MAVDTPGFQNPSSVDAERTATFQDLCHNYTQERLGLLFHDTHVTGPLNRYAQERIDIDGPVDGAAVLDDEEAASPEPLVELLDRAPQGAVARASATNLRDADRRGFLWLLDDEALGSGSERELLDKLCLMYDDRVFDKYFTRVASETKNRLVIHHCRGTNSVLYDLDGWLKAAREIPTSRNASVLLSESAK